MSRAKDKKILDQVREVMRLHHYSIHTERSYCDRIKRFIQFHRMKSRDDLENGEIKKEVSLVTGHMKGIPQLVTKLLCGSGLRIAEAIRLRVQDIDFNLKSLRVRSGNHDLYPYPSAGRLRGEKLSG